MRFAVLCLVAFASASLAGCALHPSGTPEERATRALLGFVHDITAPDGKLTELSGTAGGGGYSAPFKLEFARDGTRHASLDAGIVSFDVYCTPTGVVRVLGANVTEQRPGSVSPLDAGRLGSVQPLLDQTNLSSARAESDLVYATYVLTSGPNGTGTPAGNVTITVDRLDRVTHIEMHMQGSSLSADAKYDVRRDFHAPTPTTRVPANVRNHTSFNAGNLSWQAESVNENVSLSDLEVRVLDRAGARVATFHPAVASPQSDGGFAFGVEDRNGNARLDSGDSFWVARANWTSDRDYAMQVWDAWANGPVQRAEGLNAIPWAGVPVLALALALALALRHSRQRG